MTNLSENRRIISIQIGKPQQTTMSGHELFTSFRKSAAPPPIYLSTLNFAGDEQADLVNHGGVDKAVCVYPFEHYPYWEKELGKTLMNGDFGENLTVVGLLETDVFIGDIYKIGDALVQVSQPRGPCHKLAKKHNMVQLPLLLQNTGFTGFYFRVLREGWIGADLQIHLVKSDPGKVLISEANRLNYQDKTNIELLRRILAVEALSQSWRHMFERRFIE